MKIKSRLFFITSIAFLLLFFESCRSSKYLDDDQALVTKIELEGFPSHLKEQAAQYISTEIRPNSALNLTIYNIFNTKDGRYKSEKLRPVGEPPHILDTAMMELSALQIQRFLQSRGYFRAQITPSVNTQNKKARISFFADPDSVFRIGQITSNFDNAYIKQIYDQKVVPAAKLQTGIPYNVNDLAEIRESLYESLRNEGYYDSLRPYMLVAVDTNQTPQRADIDVQVNIPDSTSLQAYTINDVSLTIHNDAGINTNATTVQDSIQGIAFTDYSRRYRLKLLSRYMFLRKRNTYSLPNENLSYDRLYEMNGFRSVKISYEKEEGNMLNVNYEVLPRP